MKRDLSFGRMRFSVAAGLVLVVLFPASVRPEPTAAATAAFDSYIAGVEGRLAKQHASANAFLAPLDPARLDRGELVVEELTPASGSNVGNALLHDWRGTAFAPGVKAADFERMLKDFDKYPQRFSPQVLRARVLTEAGDRGQVTIRVRQQHVLTVVMDTTYDVTFGRLDERHGYSSSRSTRIAEIDAPGTSRERALGPEDEHGFLWRMNTYWSYEERDGGLYIQVESVSLTRSVPTGLGWVVDPFIESIPKQSLEFTLRSACDALRR